MSDPGNADHAARAASDRLSARLARWAAHPLAPALLPLFAVLEATVFPAPTEALLIALVLMRPRRTPVYVVGTVAASGLGAALAFAAGALLIGGADGLLAQRPELADSIASVRTLYAENLALALLSSGFTPIPFLAYTLGAGALDAPFLPFLIFAMLGRALKYAVIAGLAFAFGPAVRTLLARYGWRVAVTVTTVLVGLWLWSRG